MRSIMLTSAVMCLLIMTFSFDSVNARRTRRPKPTPTPEGAAALKLDVMYFLGGSENLRSEDNWKLVTKFCEKVNEKLNIDAGETRVGELTFADSAEIGIMFADSTSLEHVNAEFSALVPPEEKSINLAAGLDAMHDNPEFLAPAKVIVIITDAEDDVPQKGNKEALKYAKACHDAGIRLIIVGITSVGATETRRWGEIVSDPTDLIPVIGFKGLRRVAGKLTKLLLDGGGPLPEQLPRPTPTPLPSSRDLDIVMFLIGNSATLGSEDNFELVQQFGISLVEMAFDRPNVLTLAGVASFADHVHGIQGEDIKVRESIIEAVKNISYLPGQYKVNLNEAFKRMIPKLKRDNPNVRSTVIIITDAEDNVPKKGNQETLDNAQKIKDMGIRLIIVGIVHDKKQVNIKRWKKIVSNPETDLVIVKRFKQLPSAVSDVQRLIGQLPRPTPPTPTWSGDKDIVSLIIGNSATLGSEDNFELVQQFSINLANMAFERPNILTLVEVASFADHAYGFYGKAPNVRESVIEEIKNISYLPGQYKVNLNEVFKRILHKLKRANIYAGVTVIIITDAEDNVPKKGNQETLDNAQELKDGGVRLIIVGIVHDKKQVNITRWKTIVSNPDTDLVIAKRFKQLPSAASDVQRLIGQAPAQFPRPAPTLFPRDIAMFMLLIGNSATLGSEDNFELVQKFSIKLVDMLFGINHRTAVGVTSFADHANLLPGDQTDRGSVVKAIKQISYAPGQYNVNLNEAFNQLRYKLKRDDPKLSRTIIIITDAEDNVPKRGNQETLDSAQKLKDAGVRLIIVGIVHDKKFLNIKRWKKIVSNPDTDLIIVKRFQQLPSAVSDVQTLIAAVPSPPATGTCPPCPVCPKPTGRYRP